MENQHRKIAGYRELSQEEIDLMNRIKAKGGELIALQKELEKNLSDRLGEMRAITTIRSSEDREAFDDRIVSLRRSL